VGSGDLVVENATTPRINILGVTDGTLAFGDVADSDIGRLYYDHSSNYMSLWTAAAERMRINSSGRFLLGTQGLAKEAQLNIIGSANIDAKDGGILLGHRGDDVTSKYGWIEGLHYTIAEEPFAIISTYTSNTENRISVGGDSSLLNTATSIRFWTATDNITVGPNSRARMIIKGDGNIGVNIDPDSEPVNSLFDIRGDAGEPAILTLGTAELTIVDGDELGRINFQAPLESDGSDAILVAASIWAEANDTFAANNNTTDLVFATATSEIATEKMRLTSIGQVGIGVTPTRKFEIGSDDNSDRISIYHDDQNAFIEWNDGILTLKSVEAVDSHTFVGIKGSGTGKGRLYLYEEDDTEYLDMYCSSNVGYISTAGASAGSLSLQNTALANVEMFSNSTEGSTKELVISGYRTSDILRSLQIGVGINEIDTASFDGIGNYRFDGVIQSESGILRLAETVTPTPDANYGKIYTKSDNKLYFQDGEGSEHELASSDATGISSVVEDDTPELGGDLQSNGSDIIFADNDKAIFGTDNDASIYFDNSNTTISTTGDLILQTNGLTEAMRIDSDGNAGIGLTPTANMSGLSIEQGILTFKEVVGEPTSDTNYGKIYTKSDDSLYFQDGGGVQHTIDLDGIGGGGGGVLAVNLLSAGRAVTINDDLVNCDLTSGAFSLSMPAVVGASGELIRIRKKDASSNILTINADGSDTINGLSTYTLHLQYNSVSLLSDGVSEWMIV
jgi:hypothetical protein